MASRSFRLKPVARVHRRAKGASQSCDKSARFCHVMLPHMDAAYGLARYLCRDPSIAEDVVQDAFLSAYRGFDGWRGDGAKAWLLTIVRNCFLNSVRTTANAVSTCDILEWSDHPPPELIDHDGPESLASERSEAAMLRASIETLPQSFRETLILRELEELSYKEIAAITQVSIGTVMSRLSRARHMLADRLAPKSLQDGRCGGIVCATSDA